LIVNSSHSRQQWISASFHNAASTFSCVEATSSKCGWSSNNGQCSATPTFSFSPILTRSRNHFFRSPLIQHHNSTSTFAASKSCPQKTSLHRVFTLQAPLQPALASFSFFEALTATSLFCKCLRNQHLLLLQSFCLLSRTFSSQSAFEAVQRNIPSFSDLPSQC
jgi:hypothetical protein